LADFGYAYQLAQPASAPERSLHRTIVEDPMRTICFAAMSTLLCSTVAFADLSTSEVERVENAVEVVAALRQAPDKGIPEDLWGKAECVIVLPSVKKAAFGVGGEFGKGLMSCRQANTWSAPVFMELAKGSFGFQIGAQATDLVLLVMNRAGIDRMLEDHVTLGTDASVAAGPVGRTGAAATDHTLTAEVLSYSRSKGLFAGIDISGGVLRPDKDANEHAYGTGTTAKTVVTTGAATPARMQSFITSLGSSARATTGQR
jgi:lipid-binding SYLF domain-containing protein